MPFNENIREFHERHGGDANAVRYDRHWIIYRDGARIEDHWAGQGQRLEPPTDPRDLARAVTLYWEAKAEQAVRAFEEYRAEVYQTAAGAVRTNRADDERERAAEWQRLTALHQEARRCQRQLQAARDAEDRLTPAEEKERTASRAEFAEYTHRKNTEYLKRVRELRL